ncbi:MAG: hypothetical protein MRJ92_04485 [Nitrospira sp.]|nr:hypothetical protein [Nitrospira sp.]
MGLLDQLPVQAVRSVHRFNFCRSGGERLCTIDYGDLPAPCNRAVVTLPNVAHHAILQALEGAESGGLWYDSTCTGLRFDGSCVVGVHATRQGEPVEVSALPSNGWSGWRFLKVRDGLGIQADFYRYPESYLIAILKAPPGVLRRHGILSARAKYWGCFPPPGNRSMPFT